MIVSHPQTVKKDDGDSLREFVRLAEQTVEFAHLANSRLTAFSAKNLPYFSALPDEGRHRVIESLRVFNQICQDVLADGKSLSDSSSLPTL